MSSAGIAAVTQGMAASESVTGKIGINLSNANTPGYKAFETYLLSETSKCNGGVTATSRIKADIQGEITETKNEFDYAIEGDGFFVVKCGEQQKYTRSGRFETDNQNYIKSVGGCNLLGELYTEDDQAQKTGIQKDDLEVIQLDTSPIKGKVTTSADISIDLSAVQTPLGGGKGSFKIANLANKDTFYMNFYDKKGDNPVVKTQYKFVYDDTKTTPSFDSNTNTITFGKDIDQLIKSINDNAGHYIKCTKDTSKLTNINFKVLSSAGNNVRAQFDAGANIIPIMDKLGLTSYLPSGFVNPDYDPSNSKLNMAGGHYRADIKGEFSIIDSLGDEHEAFVAFKKIANRVYAVEVYTAKGSILTTRDDQLVAAGKIEFNRNGGGDIKDYSSLTNISNLGDELTFNWDSQGRDVGSPNSVNLNWKKLSEYANNQLVDIESDGKKGGTLLNTSIDKKGNLTGHYTNGDQKLLAAIPIALFKDPLKLENEFGTIFSDTADSGKAILEISDMNGAGKLTSGNLEGSNVDETTSMTELMKQQRFYSYNAKSYGMMNSMEDVLLSVIHA